ncbi:MAG: hypothetical protein ACLR0U_17320 [Enterocloster clostridioformis]
MDLKESGLRYFNIYGVNQRFDLYGNVIPILQRESFLGSQLPFLVMEAKREIFLMQMMLPELIT